MAASAAASLWFHPPSLSYRHHPHPHHHPQSLCSSGRGIILDLDAVPPTTSSRQAIIRELHSFPADISRYRSRQDSRFVAAASAAEAATSLSESGRKQGFDKSSSPLQLTYLEGNSWLWEVAKVQILVDPVLVGNLDFGIPWLYDASKKVLKDFQLENLPPLDLLVITQSLDDHCHKRTLEPLSNIFPDLHVIATPNAEPILSNFFKKVTYLEPGHSTTFTGSNGSELTIRASAGPILGPPWQRPENGYFVESKNPQFSIYFEPHCVYKQPLLEREIADVVITPVVKQVLPLFTLVSGQKDALELAKILQAKFVVPMQNGELESKGFLSKIVSSVGTIKEFQELLLKELPSVQLLEAKPGIPLDVPVTS